MPELFAEGGVRSPTLYGQEGTYVYIQPVRLCDIEIFLYPLFELARRGQVAHGTKGVYVRADGVNYVVYALLDDYRVGAADGGNFTFEAVMTRETVTFVSYAAVLAQNAGAACRTADYCRAVVGVVHALEGEIVRPALRGDAVAVEHDGAVVVVGVQVEAAEEIEGGEGARALEGKNLREGAVAEREEALGKGARGDDARTHQRKAAQIYADGQHSLGFDAEGDLVGEHLGPGGDGDALLAAEGDKTGVVQADLPVAHSPCERDAGERDGLGAAEVGKVQPDALAADGAGDGIAQGYVLGVGFGTVFGYRGRIAPDGDPLHRSSSVRIYTAFKAYSLSLSPFGRRAAYAYTLDYTTYNLILQYAVHNLRQFFSECTVLFFLSRRFEAFLAIFLHLRGKKMYEQTVINVINLINATSVKLTCKNSAGKRTP